MLLVFLPIGAVAQEPAAPEKAGPSQPAKYPDGAHIRIIEADWGPKGELVLAIRIHAGNEPLTLGTFREAKGPRDSHSPVGYSLEASALEDRRTGARLTPLSREIKKPYFGPIATMQRLRPNGWVQLGVVFPPPPDPGKNEKGEPAPYLLTFIPPGKFSPVLFEIPNSAKAEAATRRSQRRAQ